MALIWVFPKIEVPQNGCFIMEISIKLDDLGVPPFSETSIYMTYMIKVLTMTINITNVYIHDKD